MYEAVSVIRYGGVGGREVDGPVMDCFKCDCISVEGEKQKIN